MDKNWIKVYGSADFFKSELVRQFLEEHDIEAIMMNKKDSSYQFGEVQILVPEPESSKAITLIKTNQL